MKLRHFLILGALMALLPPLFAWVQSTTKAVWPTGTTVTMQLRLGVSPALTDGRTWDANAIEAMQIWNGCMHDVQFAWQSTATTKATSHDGLNDMAFADDEYGTAWGTNTLAATMTWYSGTTRTECDILFNRSETWDAYRGALQYPPSGGYAKTDFRRVAMHELGHVLGLGHPDEQGQSVSALMNATMSDIDTLTDDDKDGIGTLYGAGIVGGPTIVKQPTSVVSLVCRGAAFSVTTQVGSPLTYQWQRHPKGDGAWIDLTDSNWITGAKDAVLALTSLAASMDGDQFRCLISNGSAVTQSQAATLSVVLAGSVTIAGKVGVSDHVNGIGREALFSHPQAIAVDNAGVVYVADGSGELRKIDLAGVVTTLAGFGGAFGADDGTGAAARFMDIRGIAFDESNNLYVTDSLTTVRKVTPAGVVTTIAGMAWKQESVDGTGSGARFMGATGIAYDHHGSLFVAEAAANTIRRLTTEGVATTFAGRAGVAGHADGLGADARFWQPEGLAFAPNGDLLVADAQNNTIRKISPSGAVETFAGQPGGGGTTDGPANVAQFSYPHGLALNTAGDLFVADTANSTIRIVSSSGETRTLAGSPGVYGDTDGIGSAARFVRPEAVAFHGSGVLYIADSGNCLIRAYVVFPAPVISAQPHSTTVARGSAMTLSVAATGAGTLTYQWLFNGNPITGANSATLTITNVDDSRAGSYSVLVSNGSYSVTSAAATVTVTATASRLINLSCRARVGTDAEMLIPGFVITGAPKQLLIRAIGPALEPMGVTDYLPDPVLTLKKLDGTLVATSDNWTSTDAAAMAQAGAFALTTGSKDAALVVTLQPGMYSPWVSEKTGRTGIGLMELYDLTPDTGKLVNISTRAKVGTGAEVLIPGMVISGNAKKRLLIRAAGPALIPMGVITALADPQMELRPLGGAAIASNDNWNSNDPALSAAFSTTGAFAFTPGSKDSALIVELDPGLYTVVVKGVGDTTGIALVEVYELP